MNPQTPLNAARLTRAIVGQVGHARGGIILFPPTVFLELVIREAGKKVKCGVQDISARESGAYTGQISARMAKNAGAEYTIIGHSEKRQYEHDTDELVAQKMLRAFEAKLVPVVCVGEIKCVSIERAWHMIKKQLDAVIPVCEKFLNKKYIIVYEPTWAIGGHQKINAAQAVAMITRIKLYFRARIGNVPLVLYGGSVNGKSVKNLLSYTHLIDGFLIGSASTQIKTILTLIQTIYGQSSREKSTF